jgi:hypothetical protein
MDSSGTHRLQHLEKNVVLELRTLIRLHGLGETVRADPMVPKQLGRSIGSSFCRWDSDQPFGKMILHHEDVFMTPGRGVHFEKIHLN